MDYDFCHDWFSLNIPAWQRVIHGRGFQAKKVLEVGSYEGRSAAWIIENLAGPHLGHVFCIDCWDVIGNPNHSSAEIEAVESRFDNNMKVALNKFPATQLTKLRGKSQEVLAGLVAGHARSFDFIYVDGCHRAAEVLADLTLAFTLCKIGGLLICDDYLWNYGDDPRSTPKLAIDAFSNCYSGRVRVILDWVNQFYMVKSAE